MSNGLCDNLRKYLAGCYPNATLSDFEFVTSGWESDVYSFTLHRPSHTPQPLILRLYPGVGAVPKLTREAAGLSRLHHAGYPVPALLLQEREGSALGKPFTLMEKLTGEALWPLLAQATPPQANALLDRFGSLLAHLHQLDWRPFAERPDLYENNPAVVLDELFESSRRLYARFDLTGFLRVADWLEIHRSDITVQPAVVHLDFHANNVFLCDDGHWAVIDWTQVSISDYRADLSWTLLIMGDFGQPHWGQRILDAYSLASPIPVAHLDYFHVITHAKLLASTVVSLTAGPAELGMRPETVDSIPEQVPVLRKLSQRIQGITGLALPEVEAALNRLREE